MNINALGPRAKAQALKQIAREDIPKMPREPGPRSMNKTEASYANILNMRIKAGEVRSWRYESIKLRLANNTFYTPDFFVWLTDGTMCFDEVKGGFTREDAWLKLKIAADQYQMFTFRLCRYVKREWSIRAVDVA